MRRLKRSRRGTAPTSIQISGRAGDRQHTYTLTVNTADLTQDHGALASLWARARLADLEMKGAPETPEDAEERRKESADIALEYGILSGHTGFIAVDARSPSAVKAAAPVDQQLPAR